ncbi:hypothetical protein M9H77_30702 [Catharanthus roseus]|uniref:Uncharacterized protein n=1 Tax=Catharanthus roseus TaxID=4058 RepID=A0ACB9ZXZ7_CATRO|nr:hypothetical protein M9H77_30702 [Catharanthus roseus]
MPLGLAEKVQENFLARIPAKFQRPSAAFQERHRKEQTFCGKLGLGWIPLLSLYGDYYPDLVREFYTNMLHKTDKDLPTIIFMSKGRTKIINWAAIIARDHSAGSFRPIKKNTQSGIGASSLQLVEDDDKAEVSDDEEDKASAQDTSLMDAFQIEMWTTFEQLQINQEVQGCSGQK